EIALAGLLVHGVTPVVPAVLLHLDALAVVELVLHRDVVAVLAHGALERDLHALLSLAHGPASLDNLGDAAGAHGGCRMAKRSPSSMAMGLPSSTVIAMLSPGITISVPSGSWIIPVTSVVRK